MAHLNKAAWGVLKSLRETWPHLSYNQVLYAMRQKASKSLSYEEFHRLVEKLGTLAKKRRTRRMQKAMKGKTDDKACNRPAD